MSLITKTLASSLFPSDLTNRYYEEEASANQESLRNTESNLFSGSTLLSAALIGSRILKQIDVLPVSNEKLKVIQQVGFFTSAALLIGGCVARSRLNHLNAGPPLNDSTCLTPAQIAEFITRAKAVQPIKLLSSESADSLENLISLLEEADPKGELAYFPPEKRKEIVKAARELEAIEDRKRTKEDIQRLRKSLPKKKVKLFSLEEAPVGADQILTKVKPPTKDAQIGFLALTLGEIMKQLEAEDEKTWVDIGRQAHAFIKGLGIHLLPKLDVSAIVLRKPTTGKSLNRSATTLHLHKDSLKEKKIE